jgi:hypothetical protein
MTNGDWDGKSERRQEYCPVHNLKCEQWATTEKKLAAKVPIWVFVCAIGVIGSTATWLNISSIDRHDVVIKELTKHIDSSNEVLVKNTAILSRATHAINEVSMNQRRVMDQLKIKFVPIPDYDMPY